MYVCFCMYCFWDDEVAGGVDVVNAWMGIIFYRNVCVRV